MDKRVMVWENRDRGVSDGSNGDRRVRCESNMDRRVRGGGKSKEDSNSDRMGELGTGGELEIECEEQESEGLLNKEYFSFADSSLL